jgi:flagellar assembly protein FliH
VGAAGWATERVEAVDVQPFAYAEEPAIAPAWSEWSLTELDAQGSPLRAETGEPAAVAADVEQRLAEEAQRSFAAGRDRGREEGRTAECEAQRTARAEESRQRAGELQQLMDSFTAQRDAYLERAEHEVVKLALAVAARILRREAQMDPLLLLGAVRVALGQLASTTAARLRVPGAHADMWREAVALLPSRTLKPEVIGEEDMRLGDCQLETDLGSVDLGVRAQLSEIERGFFDNASAATAAPSARSGS